ncbi:MAG: hypothetical protein GY861_29330 [bacterium]|nr:hypothetical protein [bacterium]
MEYNIYIVEEKEYESGEIAGGDMHLEKTYKRKDHALKFSSKLSYKNYINKFKVHEIWVEQIDEDYELMQQWAYKNGVLTYHIAF